MKRLTKRQALTFCKQVWGLVASGEAKNKSEVTAMLGWQDRFENDCPACEYSDQFEGGRYCGPDCIIPWPTGHCTRPGSPYRGDATSPEDAAEIVALCDKALAKLPPLKLTKA